MKKVMLDGGIIVEVERLADRDQLRAAAIFNPKIVEDVGRGAVVRNSDAIALWRGNESYIMFIIERACRLASALPADNGWLRRIRRNADAYHINVDDLEDPDYCEALYIRHMGMTTDRFVQIVTDIAMGLKRKGNKVEAADLDDEAIEGEAEEVELDDEEGDVQAIVPATGSGRRAQAGGTRVRRAS